MKIETASIRGFGQWHDREFDFATGLNAIYGPNGSGKTTLHQFIVAMLYGFPQKRGNRVNTYQAAEQDVYGGKIIFEHQGARYELSRFGRTKSELKITNLVNQQELADPEAFLTELLGPIDRETFDAVFSFNQTDLLAIFSLKPDEFAKRLRQLAMPGSDKWVQIANDLEQAAANEFGATKTAKRPMNQLLKQVDDAKQAMQKLIAGQPLTASLLQERTDLQSRLKQLQSTAATVHADEHATLANQHLLPVLQRLEIVEEQLTKLPVMLDQQLVNEYDAITAKIAVQTPNGNDELPSAAAIGQASDVIAQLAINDREQKLLVQRQLDLQAERQHIMTQHGWQTVPVATIEQGASTITTPVLSKVMWALAGLALVVAVVGLLGQQTLLAGIFMLVGLISVGVGFQSRKQGQSVSSEQHPMTDNSDEGRLKQLDQSITENNARLQELMPKMSELREQLAWIGRDLSPESYQQKLANFQAEVTTRDQQRTQLAQLRGQQATLLAQLVVKDSTDLTIRRQADEQRRNLHHEQQTLTEQLGGADRNALRETLGKTPQTSDVELNTAMNQVQQEIATIDVRLERLANDGQIQQAKQKLADLQAEASFELKNILVDRLAAQWINATLSTTIGDRLPDMLRLSQQYFAFLTNNRYQQIDSHGKQLQVIDQNGQAIKVIELSKGTAEQLYVAMRLAFSQIVSANVNLPLLIDDAFVDFDAERYERMINLLGDLSEDQQIIYFTIKAPKFDAKVIDLNTAR